MISQLIDGKLIDNYFDNPLIISFLFSGRNAVYTLVSASQMRGFPVVLRHM